LPEWPKWPNLAASYRFIRKSRSRGKRL
jgi:hypothetical protein